MSNLHDDVISLIEANLSTAVELVTGPHDHSRSASWVGGPNSATYWNLTEAFTYLMEHDVFIEGWEVEKCAEGVQNVDQMITRMSESCYNNQLKEAVEERLDSILWALEDIRKYYRGEPGALRLIEEDIDSAIHSYAIGAPGPSFALHAKGFVERLPE